MNKTLRLLTLAAALVSAGPVLAQTPAKETPPAPAPPRDFALPAPKQFVLDNGLSVTLVNYGNTPKVNVGLYVAAGNSYEKAGEVWLGDLTGQLMREGTATKTSAQISKSRRADGRPGRHQRGRRHRLGLRLLALRVRSRPGEARGRSRPQSEVPGERTRTLEGRQPPPPLHREEQPAADGGGEVPRGRLRRSPLRPDLPDRGADEGYTLAQARAFYEANWAASRARLYVAGRFDAAAVETAIRAAFAGWKKGAMSHPAPPKPRADRAVYIVDKPGAVQTTLIVGLPTIDASQKDAIPLAVTNNVLGGYFSSRMTANLRENKGYTYSPYSQVSNRYRDATWAQNADVTTAVTGASLKEIFHEIDRLQAEAPGEAELESVKNYMLGTFVLRNSDRFGIISQLEFINFHGLPADYLNRYVGNVRAVTPAAVQQMAQKYIDDTKTAIIAVGDKKVIEEQVKPYGPIWSTTR